MRQFVNTLAALLLGLGLPLSANAEAPVASIIADDALGSTWAFETSDLPVDPEFRFGVLPNGMRYIVRHNATPAGTGEVRLVVNSGSTSETAAEQGYAHFIEHMAFNGSTNVPEGEMVKLLEREGLAFGADTNASTSFETTLYMLDLPRNDPALLDTSLMLMRETASELLFDQEAVDRERGVILSEKRVRDTYSYRNLTDRLDFLYPGSRFAERLPIGETERLLVADSAALKDLYRRLYTPRNSALVVVGDFDSDLVEAKIREHFADWEPAPGVEDPPARPYAGPIDPDRKGMTDIHIDPALSERVTASRNSRWVEEPDTQAVRFQRMLRQIGYGIVNRRMSRLANSEAPPFRDAALGTAEVYRAGRTTNIVMISGDAGWKAGLEAAVSEYRRALAYGFSEAEIAEQLANIHTSIENAVALAETRSNSTHTAAALALIQDERVPTTPQSSLERFEAYLPQITPEAVLEALLADSAPLDDAMLRFEGREAPEGGEAALRAAWDEAMAAPVERAMEFDAGPFGYTYFGPSGTIVSDTVDARMDIRELVFANGVRLNLKRTDLKKDRISYSVAIDGGDMLNTRDNPLATGLVSGLPLGGLGKHTYDELQSIMAGRNVSVGISSDERNFRMGGTTTPGDLELQLQLLTAAITDPGYRPQGETRFRGSVKDFFASKDATPGSAVSNALGGIVSDGDPRFSVPPEEDYLALDYAGLKADIADRLAQGAIEIGLVGDFDEDQAIALVAATLGALPAREPDFRSYDDNRHRTFTEDRAPRIVYHTGNPDQAQISFLWPTRDDSDPMESMALALLDRVVQIELTDVLREKLGQTYAPSVRASQSRTYFGYGTFTTSAAVDVADVADARQAMIETISALRAAPVDQDVLLRAKRPVEEQYDNALKTNEGWLSLVGRAQSESDRIDRFGTARDRLAAIDPAQLQALALKYLDPEQRLEILALPRPAEQPTAEPEPSAQGAEGG